MKTIAKLLLVALTACMITACSEKPVSPDTPYVIEGEVMGVKDGVVITLFLKDTGGSTLLGSDTIVNGKFRFEQVMQEPEQNQTFLVVMDEDFPPMMCNIYLAPGASIKVKGNGPLIATWDVESQVPEQQESNALLSVVKNEYDAMQRISLDLPKKRAELRSINRDGFPERYNTIRNEYNRMIQQDDSLELVIDRKQIEKMKTMKPTAFWMNRLYYMALSAGSDDEYPFRDDAVSLYELLPDELKQTEQGKEIRGNLYPPEMVKDGDVCPDADFLDLEGKQHHLSEYRGKYLLIDFWSMGCGACILAFPEMKEVYEQYGDKLAIVSLSVDNDSRWRNASKRHNITWDNWNEGKRMGGISVNFRVSVIPHYVLVNPEGKIEKQLIGYEEGMFKTLFSELFNE